MNVGKVFNQKLLDQSLLDDKLDSSTSTPTDIGGIEEAEFGTKTSSNTSGHFTFPENTSQYSSLS